MNTYPSSASAIASAVAALKAQVEEVNRLNVFPVPDGDTGSNMLLTLEAVLNDVAKLGERASLEEVCGAATHGSLMGARGNSGVILSQIIRGACEGIVASDGLPAVERLAAAMSSATQVAYQAVRKPVEGTMLTVVKDMSAAATDAAQRGIELDEALDTVLSAAADSVRRTPELLPVLKDAGVVDAGGFGLQVVFAGFVGALLGREVVAAPIPATVDTMSVVPVDDWDDDEYLYCTEFLLFGEGIDREAVHDFMVDMGGSELVVGDHGEYKIHVHTNTPSEVLAYALSLGEVAEVHIHNMRRQQAERGGEGSAPSANLSGGSPAVKAAYPIGVVAVASGSGITEILKSIGVDVVVSGGQTMNPSTQDLVDAAQSLDAESIIIMPNNKNIVMAANAAVTVLDRPAAVVPTKSVLEGFAAMLAFDGEDSLGDAVYSMTDAAAAVKTGEVTTAVKDAKSAVGDITAGQVIGIVGNKEIVAVGQDTTEVALDLLGTMADEDSESLTVLIGEDMTDEEAEAFSAAVGERFPGLELDVHRGEQPLYPIVMSVE